MHTLMNPEYYHQRFIMAGVTDFMDIMSSRNASATVRFSCINRLLKEHNILPVELSGYKFSCARESESIRQKGNVLFKSKEYTLALKCYNRSLFLANHGTEMYGHALANRSAVFFRLNKYEHCLLDIKRTLKSKYPTNLVFKLYERAGNVERLLGYGESAKRNYEECLKHLDGATLSEKIKSHVKTRVMDAIEMCEGLVMYNPVVEKQTFGGDLLGGKNENIPALSAFLELKYSETFGRGVYATRDINPGDVVLIEEPYIGIPQSNVNYVCNYSGCLKFSLAFIPCPNCSLVVYCDEYCMKMDENDGHSYQCIMMYSIDNMPGMPKLNELIIKIFLKEYCKTDLEEYCSVVKNWTETSEIDPLTRGFVKHQYKSESFSTVYSLKLFESRKSKNYLFLLNCIAAELLHYLMISGLCIPESYITTVGVSFVHMLNNFDFVFWNFAQKYGPCVNKLNYNVILAYALYPSIFLFNHSCDPNVKRSGVLSDKTSVLTAVQPISKGSQLFISYATEFHQYSQASRQSLFNSLDLFQCKCQPCIENWPYGRFIPNRLSPLTLLNTSLADTISLECSKFLEYLNKVKPGDSVHLDYLYNFAKLLSTNVKRPFQMYEDCIREISSGHILTREDDLEYSCVVVNLDLDLYLLGL